MHNLSDDSLSALLVQVGRAHRSFAEAQLTPLGLYPGQEFVLLQLANQSAIAQSELAERMCVEAPTVTRSLQRLEKAGLVYRQADSEDGRIQRVHLTEQGAALIQPLKNIWAELERTMLTDMSAAEQALFRRLLQQALSNLQQNQPHF